MTTSRSPHVVTSHDGPIHPDCPIDCLLTVLSSSALNYLGRCYDAPFDPPQTVGEVVELYQQDQLGSIHGLGPRRLGEIQTGLVFAGLVLSDRPRS